MINKHKELVLESLTDEELERFMIKQRKQEEKPLAKDETIKVRIQLLKNGNVRKEDLLS